MPSTYQDDPSEKIKWEKMEEVWKVVEKGKRLIIEMRRKGQDLDSICQRIRKMEKDKGEMIKEEKEEEGKSDHGCTTIECCIQMIIETLWEDMNDPANIAVSISSFFKEHMHMMSNIMGPLLTFTLLNLVVYVTTKFTEIWSGVKKLFRALLDLPLITLVINIWKWSFGWALDQTEKLKTDEIMEERLDSLMKTIEKVKENLDYQKEKEKKFLRKKLE